MNYTPEEETKLKEEIKKIVTEHPHNYAGILTSKAKKYLKDYIDFKTPLLNDEYYSMATRCFWILNSLEDFPRCKTCGKPIKHNVKVTVGYSPFCSVSCAQSDPSTIARSKQTRLIRYGSANFTNIEKSRQTMLKRYGVEHQMYLQSTKDKIKETCLKHFGVDSNLKTKEFEEARRKTWKEKYRNFKSIPARHSKKQIQANLH